MGLRTAKTKDVFVGHDGYNLERLTFASLAKNPRNPGEIGPSKGFFNHAPHVI